MTTTPAELIALVGDHFRDVHIEGTVQEGVVGAPFIVFDSSKAEPEVNWPGEFIGLFDTIKEAVEARNEWCCKPLAAALEAAQAGPIPMILHCPACHLQHIDAPEESLGRRFLDPGAKEWDNPPHRSHLCHGCGSIWRPADVPTEGVAAIQTKGSADGLVPQPQGSGDYVLVPREPGSCEGDDSGWILMFLNALHAHLPEDERPSSWMQFSDDQRERICNAYRAMISAATPADGG